VLSVKNPLLIFHTNLFAPADEGGMD